MKRFALALFFTVFAAPAFAEVVAGGNVDIDHAVEGNLYVAGGNVNITGPVTGNARIAGGDVTVKGNIGGKLAVAGGNVTLDGPVGGNVTVSGGQLELGPNARIAGKLDFRGGNLEQDPAARVQGGVTRTHRASHHWDAGPFRGGWFVRGMWTVGLMLLAAVIAGALPGPARRMQEELRMRPWLAALFGMLALICIPIAAVIVMITVIGIPLGLLAILGYVALLLVGYVATAVLLSGLILDRYNVEAATRTAWRVGAAVLAMLVLSTLAHTPYVGGFIGLVALVMGVGAIVGAIVHRKQLIAPPAAA
jgi:cytoskeletal protein CcmA (bactofilin family)